MPQVRAVLLEEVVLLGQAVLPGQRAQVDLVRLALALREPGQALLFLVISKESRGYKRAGAGADMANTLSERMEMLLRCCVDCMERDERHSSVIWTVY